MEKPGHGERKGVSDRAAERVWLPVCGYIVMADIISKRISDAINDIENIRIMFQQRYGADSDADREISAVLKIARREHKELIKYRALGTAEELAKKLK